MRLRAAGSRRCSYRGDGRQSSVDPLRAISRAGCLHSVLGADARAHGPPIRPASRPDPEHSTLTAKALTLGSKVTIEEPVAQSA
jgi:hypothetical protein